MSSSVKNIFGTTIFLGAFLLFLIQPLVGKFLLPFFGGSSGVWSVALMFFMAGLLLGYLYAYLLSRLPKKFQLLIHGLVLICGFALSFNLWHALTDQDLVLAASQLPELQILKVLLAIIGLPYLILSATGPLLQSWYATLPKASEPYRFYSLSNLASLLAIASYPFLIEPLSRLPLQGKTWTAAFWLFALGFAACLWLFFQKGINIRGGKAAADIPGKPKSNYAVWILLAFIPVLLLLATTNEITKSIAPVPFLWLLPLGIYLFSFVWAFAWEFEEKVMVGLAVLLLTSVLILIWADLVSLSLFSLIPLYLVVLFLTSLLCHNALYRLRPEPSRLTLFYVVLALGGALGGIFATFLAPALFKDYWELGFGLFLASLVSLLVLNRLGGRPFVSLRRAGLIVIMLFILIGFNVARSQTGVIKSVRNFYGVLKIKKQDYGQSLYLYSLYNGDILHGSQFSEGGFSHLEPTTYYTRSSGVGLVFKAHPAENRRVGVVGLGVGTVAAYCLEGDYFRFYEINPAVIELAQNDFWYLKNCPGTVEVIEGDARLSMAYEQRGGQQQNFDILIIDAFTDDSIPVHLLTKEAFAIYLAHLEPQSGIIAVHISNRYLDLSKVVAGAAADFNLQHKTIHSGELPHNGLPSVWMLLSKNADILNQALIRDAALAGDDSQEMLLWTDSYSNLLPLLKF